MTITYDPERKTWDIRDLSDSDMSDIISGSEAMITLISNNVVNTVLATGAWVSWEIKPQLR